MTQIRCIYFPDKDGARTAPTFPATDQHPQAVRYPVDHPTRGALNVDAVGPAPTLAEVDAILGLDAPALAAAVRIAVDATDAATCVADPNVATFLNMSPADLDAWVDTNITGAGNAAARTAFKVLGKLALTAARGRKLRNGG